MKIITEDIQEKCFIHAALEKRGYIVVDSLEYDMEYFYIKTIFTTVYKKNEKYYGLLKYEDFNGFIYEATLVEADDFGDLECFIREKEIKELEESLTGEELTLDELESEVYYLLENDCESIYDRVTLFYEGGKIGDEGAFAWAQYNVFFTVLKEAEDMGEIVVKVEKI